jgi:hypothetical protein
VVGLLAEAEVVAVGHQVVEVFPVVAEALAVAEAAALGKNVFIFVLLFITLYFNSLSFYDLKGLSHA